MLEPCNLVLGADEFPNVFTVSYRLGVKVSMLYFDFHVSVFG